MQAFDYIEKIDDMGGALSAIEQNYIQNEIHAVAYQFQRDVETHEEIVVGVNKYQIEEEMPLERLQIDPIIETQAKERLKALRASRDPQKTSELFTRLGASAKSSENLMPLLIEAVENNITLGEICNVLRQEWGEYQPT
ncbi:MAG: methylmalonyl-CoA mutase family protein, partial [Chloroflexota bacterium]